MTTRQSQELIEKTAQEHIGMLMDIILSGNEESVTFAAMHLALIGSKESADALMTLIKEVEGDAEFQHHLASLLIWSAFRDDYRKALTALFGDTRDIDDDYERITDVDARLLSNPLWLQIANALTAVDHTIDNERRGIGAGKPAHEAE